MKAVRGALIGSAFLLATATSGFAQDMTSWIPYGFYVRGDVGGAFGQKVTYTDTNPGSALCGVCSGSIPASTGNSVLFGGGIGYRFNPMFRTDLTIDYIPSLHASGTAVGGGPLVAGETDQVDISSLVGMANGYLDLNGFMPHTFGGFQPYVDFGVGLAHNELGTATGKLSPALGALPFSQTGADRTNFAWGAGAGIGYALTPNLTLDIAYKYLDLGATRTGTSITALGATGAVTAAKSNDLTAHTVTLGLRWAFGAPPASPPPVAAPPAPPPAVAAPAQQMFIVFFEFDKSALTADGKKVVDAAAAAFKSGKSGVAIAGYTDLAGTQQYNLALSKRRAETVKAALVKDGVPAAAIDEAWHGKENPRVPTANGVREPQNRRVEITM
ncbi:MAG TPA: OmpA family protein [Stellaceae bacterium]|jgi:outer membrane protein OmpA-like peptidoglycan-associated protein